MSEINLIVEEKPKKKSYTEAQKRAIYEYRKRKGTTYTQCQKESIYKYNAKIKEYAKKYKELITNGSIPIETQ